MNNLIQDIIIYYIYKLRLSSDFKRNNPSDAIANNDPITFPGNGDSRDGAFRGETHELGAGIKVPQA
jgi:hypothetical protein